MSFEFETQDKWKYYNLLIEYNTLMIQYLMIQYENYDDKLLPYAYLGVIGKIREVVDL